MNWPLSYSFQQSWATSDQNTLNLLLVYYSVLSQSLWSGKTGPDLRPCRCGTQYWSIIQLLSLQNSRLLQTLLQAPESRKFFTKLHNEGQAQRQFGSHPPVLWFHCKWMQNQRRKLILCLLCGWASHAGCYLSKCKWAVSQRRLDMHQGPYCRQRFHLHNLNW